jgi:hypothetical protein
MSRKHVKQPLIMYEIGSINMGIMDVPKGYTHNEIFSIDSWYDGEGWSANNQHQIMDCIVSDDIDARGVMQGLKRLGLLKKQVRLNMLSIMIDDSMIAIDKANGEQLYTIQYSYEEWTHGKDRIESQKGVK